MIEQDTIRLLRECDSGAKMGISALSDVMGFVKNDKLKSSLTESMSSNHRIEKELQAKLRGFHDDGKEPHPVAKSMSWLKTNFRLMMNGTDSTVADLITDGCNMGIKSLNRYLNEYTAADEDSKQIARDLIGTEERLAFEIREFL